VAVPSLGAAVPGRLDLAARWLRRLTGGRRRSGCVALDLAIGVSRRAAHGLATGVAWPGALIGLRADLVAQVGRRELRDPHEAAAPLGWRAASNGARRRRWRRGSYRD
jgi:hypothetical protein